MSTNAPCPRCQVRGKTWEGSDPTCAFPGGRPFDPDNWNCATANAIRDIVYEGQQPMPGVDYRYCDDQKYATVWAYPIEGVSGSAVWVTWYKRRGRTERIIVLDDHVPPHSITLEEAEALIEYYEDDA